MLRALSLRPRARVGVPIFMHPVVWQTIVAAGMQPVFLDTDPLTLGLSLEDLRKKRNIRRTSMLSRRSWKANRYWKTVHTRSEAHTEGALLVL